jgi:hypothetical protein
LEAPTPTPQSPSSPRSSFDGRGDADTVARKDTEPTEDEETIRTKKNVAANTIVIRQDVSGAAQTHTGGIVWETSYLLLNFLLSSNGWLSISKDSTITVLEIGAGCGLLGLSLHRAFALGILGETTLSSRVVVTETREVLDNLKRNLEANFPTRSDGDEGLTATTATIGPPAHQLSVEELDWTRFGDDCAKADIKAGSVDCIFGTDVVFSTRFVKPMLETMAFLSHPSTVVYLCLQERCKDAHELLLSMASSHGFCIEDVSKAVYEDEALAESCGFGNLLDCKLLKFTVMEKEKPGKKTEKKAKKKEAKKSKKDKKSKAKI